MHDPPAPVPPSRGLAIRRTRVYHGPSLWAFKPIVHLTLDLGDLESHSTDRLEGFTDRLLALLPTLWEHRCSVGEPGGFVERMRSGTWMGHVLEHVAVELQCLCGQHVEFGLTRATAEAGVYEVIFEFVEECVGREASRLGVELLQAVVEGRAFPLEDRLADLAQMADDVSVGPSTQALLQEARRRRIPVIRLDRANLVQLGYGRHQQRIRATTTSLTRMISVDVAGDKALARHLLSEVGIPVPHGIVVDAAEAAEEAAARLGYPLVVKPIEGSHGDGITLDVRGGEQLRAAFDLAHSLTSRVLIERSVPGRDYRVLVVDGEVVAVAERVPATVVGDGSHTVAELIERLNADPRRGVGHERVLTRVRIDQQTMRLLGEQGLTLDSLPEAARKVLLKSTASLSMGGTSVDCTDDICFENMEMATRAARIVGLDVAGVDFICSDVAQPLAQTGGVVVEVNSAPGLRMHVAPAEGRARDVAGPILDMLFPPSRQARIPLMAITGTNGKTTTSRMCAHILKMGGHKVGLTTTDGIYIDGTLLRSGDLTGPWSAQMVLRDPGIDFAVLETARGGILRAGLGFDRCDVGAVLNVTEDHLGMDGVDTLEDLAQVKSLVIEVVQASGWGVLNAEDESCVGMASRCGGRTAWFSTNPDHAVFRTHMQSEGLGATCDRGSLVILDGRKRIAVVGLAEIPATHGGLSGANVKNALAAAIICYAAAIPVEDIRQGLKTFDASYFLTPGRLNVIDVRDFRVVMDYAHNIAAFEEMARFVGALPKARSIGIVAGPGDRQDHVLRRLGEIAGRTFDLLVIKEDDDIRGRKPGESAALLEEGVRGVRCGGVADAVRVVLPEAEAVDMGLGLARKDDLLVILADQPLRTWQQVLRFRQRGTEGG